MVQTLASLKLNPNIYDAVVLYDDDVRTWAFITLRPS
jgi:hypothetical protein